MSEVRSCFNSPPCVVHWAWEVLIHDDRLHSESNGGVGSPGWGSGEWGRRERGWGRRLLVLVRVSLVGSLVTMESSRGTGLSPPL